MKPYMKSWQIKPEGVLLLLGICLGACIRIPLFPLVTYDATVYLPYYEYLHMHGMSGLSHSFPVSHIFLYFLLLATFIPIKVLYIVKLISLFFEALICFFVYKIVRLRYKDNSFPPVLACLCFLFTPAVIINSSYWGQWDTVHISLIMASLYYLLLNNLGSEWKVVLLFTASLTCKPAAPLILLPIYAAWALQNKNRIWKLLLCTPLLYVLSIIPCWFLGRSFTDLLLVDWKVVSFQRGYSLTFNAPTIYQWLPNKPEILVSGSLYVLSIMLLMTFVFSYIKHAEKRLSQYYINMAMLSSLLIPFLSPMMHERYFFLADILSIIFAFYYPRLFFISIILNLCSFFSFYPYLFNQEPPIPLQYLSIVTLALIILLIQHLLRLYLLPKPVNTSRSHE